MPDQHALRILMNCFWTSEGWRPEAERRLDPAELEYARRAGVMFDPVVEDHSTVVGRVVRSVSGLTLRRVSDAFIASLSTRRLHQRSALGTYSVFRSFRPHAPPTTGIVCSVCGLLVSPTVQDVNAMSFERFKWGGVRHLDPIYAAFDLDRFAAEESPPHAEADVQILRNILRAIRAAQAGTTPATHQKLLAKILPSNKAERDILIGILGFTGILRTPGHPNFLAGFVAHSNRDIPGKRFVEMAYPACWWDPSYGFDDEAAQEVFGHVL